MPSDFYNNSDVVNDILDRRDYRLAEDGIIHAIDGDRVDIQLLNSPGIIRNCEVQGDMSVLQLDQQVALRWRDGRPVVMIAETAASQATYIGAGFIPPDNQTIEVSVFGLRVKEGGLGPQHMSYVPAMGGHKHNDDPLTRTGWQTTETGVIFKDDTFIFPYGAISLGRDTNAIKLDATHPDYRMWVGGPTPELAGMKITRKGTIVSGYGDGTAFMSGVDVDNWNFWVGDDDPDLAPFRVKKTGEVWLDDAHIAATLESQNYQQGTQGWHIDSSGWAEFSDVTIRGKIQAVVFEYSRVSAVGGRMIVTDATTFLADCADTDTTMDVSGHEFAKDDLLQVNPDAFRNEWIRCLDGGSVITGGFRYTIERNLNGTGAEDFLAGETLVRKGSSGTSFTLGSNPTRGWGARRPGTPLGWGGQDATPSLGEPWGGRGWLSAGGWLTIEGSRDYGPYFGVSLRFGPVYNQIADVARLGRLKGFLGISTDEYGVGIGDTNQHLLYTYNDGLEIATAGGDTTIDQDGVATEKFGMRVVGESATATDGMIRFFSRFVDGDHKVYANFLDGVEEDEVVWLSFNAGGVQASDADTVDSIHASSSSEVNKLCALDGTAKGPFSITGDANTVDDLHGTDLAKLASDDVISGTWTFQGAAQDMGIQMKWTGDASYTRIFQAIAGPRLDISTNAEFTGALWERDNVSHPSTLFVADSGLFEWYFATAAANPIDWTQYLELAPTLIHFNRDLADIDVRMGGDTDAWLFEMNAGDNLLNFRNTAFQTFWDIADIGTPPATPGAGFYRVYMDDDLLWGKDDGGTVRHIGHEHNELNTHGANMITNGGFAYDQENQSPQHWIVYDPDDIIDAPNYPRVWVLSTDWTLEDGDSAVEDGALGSTCTFHIDTVYNVAEEFIFYTDYIPVEIGQTYSSHVLLADHRIEADTIYANIRWYTDAFVYISETAKFTKDGAGVTEYAAGSGGTLRTSYDHMILEGMIAPATAQFAVFVVHCSGYTSGESDGYLWVDQAKFEIGQRWTPFTPHRDYPRRKYIEWAPVGWSDDLVVGDGQFFWHCPKYLNGWHLAEVHGEIITAGVTGNTDFQIRNVTQAVDMLTNKIQVETGETGSDTATTQPSINTSNYVLSENDRLALDIDLVATGTPPQGAIITLGLDPPRGL
jgi:hypothetical protein